MYNYLISDVTNGTTFRDLPKNIKAKSPIAAMRKLYKNVQKCGKHDNTSFAVERGYIKGFKIYGELNARTSYYYAE